MQNFRRKDSAEKLLHKLLPKLLLKKAPSVIPLTGKKTSQNDFYTIHLGNEHSVVDYDPTKRILNVFTLDEAGSYTIRNQLTLQEALGFTIKVTHYYRTSWKDYTSIQRLNSEYKAHWFQIQVLCKSFCNHLSQWFFNKKPLWLIHERMDLLEFIIKRHLGSEGSIASPNTNESDLSFSAFELMTSLRSPKWIYHPQSQSAKRRMDLLLNAFVESGDLKKEGIYYTLAPSALKTFEDYKVDERRHLDSVTIQNRIGYLTLLIVLATVAQVYYTAKSSESSHECSQAILNAK